ETEKQDDVEHVEAGRVSPADRSPEQPEQVHGAREVGSPQVAVGEQARIPSAGHGREDVVVGPPGPAQVLGQPEDEDGGVQDDEESSEVSGPGLRYRAGLAHAVREGLQTYIIMFAAAQRRKRKGRPARGTDTSSLTSTRLASEGRAATGAGVMGAGATGATAASAARGSPPARRRCAQSRTRPATGSSIRPK